MRILDAAWNRKISPPSGNDSRTDGALSSANGLCADADRSGEDEAEGGARRRCDLEASGRILCDSWADPAEAHRRTPGFRWGPPKSFACLGCRRLGGDGDYCGPCAA